MYSVDMCSLPLNLFLLLVGITCLIVNVNGGASGSGASSPNANDTPYVSPNATDRRQANASPHQRVSPNANANDTPYVSPNATDRRLANASPHHRVSPDANDTPYVSPNATDRHQANASPHQRVSPNANDTPYSTPRANSSYEYWDKTDGVSKLKKDKVHSPNLADKLNEPDHYFALAVENARTNKKKTAMTAEGLGKEAKMLPLIKRRPNHMLKGVISV